MEKCNTGAAAMSVQDEDSVMSSWITVDEETSMELSKLLESFDLIPPPVKVRFIDNPYSSSMVFQSSSAYVTINCNEETCGSSFSDSESSAMASIDFGGGNRLVSYGAWGVGTPVVAREFMNEGSGENYADMEFDLDALLTDGGVNSQAEHDEDALWREFLLEDVFGTLNGSGKFD